MKFNRYLLTLIVVPVLLFTAKSYAQNITPDVTARDAKSTRAFVVNVVEQSGSTITINGMTDKTTLPDIVNDLDVLYYPEDRLSVFPDLFMEMGGVITLKRAPKITVYDGKRQTMYRSWAANVSDLLAEERIELGADDQVSPSLESALSDGGKVQINRVAITTVVETKEIDFSTKKKNDPDLDDGKIVVEAKGAKGTKEYTYEVTRQDGEEVFRRLLDTKVTREPVIEVLRIGTRPVITVPCRFNSTVIAAALKNNVKANDLCYRMMKESRGNPGSVNRDCDDNGDGTTCSGLFQYKDGLWATVSKGAGYSGADILNPEAQIYVTAWAWSHGYRGRWPNP